MTDLDTAGVDTSKPYPTEWIANGETQVIANLTDEQINEVTNLIIDLSEGR